MEKNYSRYNFHLHTFCIWQEVPSERIKDYKINYTSQSGSQYIYTEKGLYRISNHWGRVANCHWRLIPLGDFKIQNITVAFAHWSDFYSNDDNSRLFFIRVNEESLDVNFYHKRTAGSNESLILRNARDTAKIIRQIKEVLTESQWAKHLKFENLDVLRKQIVAELITTNKSFLEIKRRFQ